MFFVLVIKVFMFCSNKFNYFLSTIGTIISARAINAINTAATNTVKITVVVNFGCLSTKSLGRTIFAAFDISIIMPVPVVLVFVSVFVLILGVEDTAIIE